MSSDNENCELSTPIQAHAIKKGMCVLIKGHPCKVLSVKTSKPGKHGHVKCRITGLDVITGAKFEAVRAGHIVMQAAQVEKTDVVLSYVEEGKGKKKSFGFLDEHGATVDFDLVDSKERQELLAAKIADKDAEFDFEVTVVSAPVAVGAVADDEDLHLKLVHAVYQWKAVRGE